MSLSSAALIKVDTDGYDSECILSLGEFLRKSATLLYWENEICNDEQAKKFSEMTDFLSGSGYTAFFMFDNFGNYLCETNAAGMKDINYYLLRSQEKKSAVTFSYVDVLAAGENQHYFCRKIIQEYLSNFNS